MARRSTEEVGINMTPMIDIVFQLIIFFVVTAAREQQTFDERIRLALAPHGPAIEKKDPRTVVVDVNDKGHISIAKIPIRTSEALVAVLKQAVGRGGPNTPIQIRGDAKTLHEDIRVVMEACGRAGLWRVTFVATKQTADQAKGARRGR